MSGYGVTSEAYRRGLSYADLTETRTTPTEGDTTMPRPLTSGPAWQLGRNITKGTTYDETDLDRIAAVAGLTDTDRARFRAEATSLTSRVSAAGPGTPEARQAAADFADRWHDRLEPADPNRHEMDPAKLAQLGQRGW